MKTDHSWPATGIVTCSWLHIHTLYKVNIAVPFIRFN